MISWFSEQNGGDARVVDVEPGSLTVTASQGGTAPDRRLFAPCWPMGGMVAEARRSSVLNAAPSI